MSTINQAPVLTNGDGNGIVTLDFGSYGAFAPNVALQADGKILVNSYAMNYGTRSELVRYNADGTLDTAFGAGGIVTTGAARSTGADVAVQTDGKIVVAGSNFTLARYNSDGSLDPSFGTGGTVASTFGTTGVSSLVIQADGKIVAAGLIYGADGYDLALARYDTAGNLDASFGIGGKVTTGLGGGSQVNSISSEADGKLVVAALVENGGHYDFTLVRYNNDGALDASFGTGGKVTTDFASGADMAYSVTVQADGKTVAAGYAGIVSGVPQSFAIARYNVDGSLDASFGSGGKVTTDMGGNWQERIESLQIQPDGKIVAAGYSFAGPGGTEVFALARYTSDGTLDSSFGTGGKVLTSAGSDAHANGLVLQPDGKMLVVGTAGTGSDLALARYNSDGSLDASFGADTGAALGGPAFFIEGASPVVLNARATVHDAELAAAGSYDGAALTLARHDGANADDVFGASGNLSALDEGSALVLSGVTIGTVTHNSGGMLVLGFGAAATEARVDEALRDITYLNSSDDPDASTRIDWSFSDGNTGVQGDGGPLAAGGSTTVYLTNVNDQPVNTVPGPVSAQADTDVAITGLSVADPDSTSLVTVLHVLHGTLTVAAVGGVTVQGSGSSLVVLRGSAADINTTLGASQNVLYHSAPDFSGADTLTISSRDGGDGVSAVGSDFDTVAINVAALPGSLAINDVTISEGFSGSKVATFTVTRSGGTAPVDIDYATADGTATATDNDYVATSGTLHFAAGVSTRTISVTINGDARIEGDESFTVNLSGATNGATIADASGTGTITNDDAAGSVAINDVTIAEGDSGSKLATFTVTRSGGDAAFAVDFATADGSATVADHDYAATSGTLNFAAGVDTQTVSVTVNGDTRSEPGEAFTVNLSGATNGATIADGSGTATIADDDAEPAGAVAINDVTISEGDGGSKLATFTVTRSGGTAPISVNFATADGSATVADGDYRANAGTLNFAAGVNTQTTSIAVNGDTKFESDEAFTVNLSGATGGATIADASGTATITNDDAEVAGSLVIDNVMVTEGDSGTTVATLTVTRSGGTAAFAVNFATSDSTATVADHDYVASSGTLNFAAGVNTRTIPVAVNGDIRLEPVEVFNVNLSGATNGATIFNGQGLVFIANDDVRNHAPAVTVPQVNVSAHSGQPLQAAGLFSASDADGDALTYYLYDNSPEPSSGHFVIDGVALAAQETAAVSASQLARATFVAGGAGSSDNLYVLASDGELRSDLTLIHVGAVNHAPDVTVPQVDVSAHSGQPLQAASLFGASDEDGDALTYYLFDNSPAPASGHFVVDGVAVAAQETVALSAAQLAHASFVPGAAGASDNLYVLASDGELRSELTSIHVDAVNHAPAVTVPQVDLSGHSGQPLRAASLFGAGDADGDVLTYYLFDNSPDPASGHFVVDGVAMPAEETIAVSAAQLAHTAFVPGAGGASDNLYVLASDGELRSDLAWIHVDSVNRAPVTTVAQANVSAHSGQPVQAASLFGASDADGDALTYYLFDNNPDRASGHFVVDGVAVAAQETAALSAAQLAHTTFVPGAPGSSDNLYVMTSDGELRSELAAFHVDSLDQAPVVSVPQVNVSAHSGELLQAASLFSASDADGDALSWYLFDNSPDPSSGHFVVDGVAVAAQDTVAVSAAQLAHTAFVAGAAGSSDNLYVMATDGELRSTLSYFHVDSLDWHIV